MSRCQHCAQLERQYKEVKLQLLEKEVLTKQVLQSNDDKDLVIQDLKDRLKEQKQKLDAYYKRTTQIMNESGSQENTNDELSNTRLAERFDGSVKNQWLTICTLYGTINQIQYLTTLSGIIETVFKHTARMVNDTESNLVQLAQFANEDQNEVRHTIRVLRQRLGQKQSTRDNVLKDIVSKVKDHGTVQDLFNQHKVPETVATIETFIYDLADICWLMCISNPPLKLNFDVKGVDFKNIKNRFTEYTIIGNNTYSDGKSGAVYLVAWPSVELEDNTGFLKKGEVIVCK